MVDRNFTHHDYIEVDEECTWFPPKKKRVLVSMDIPLRDPRDHWTPETLAPALPSWWWDEVEGKHG